jgi:tetratricopeptide (TPR) repeat protein
VVRLRRLAVLLAVVGAAAVAGWYGVRTWNRSAERDAALELARSGRADEAVPALKRCLDRDPDDPEVLRALVETLTRTDTLVAEVEPYLDRWCALQPDDPEPFRQRADLRFRLGRREDALADARRVLELAPGDHATRQRAAGLAVELGQHELAERELTTLLTSSGLPKEDVGTRLAVAYWTAGDHARSQEALDRYAPPGTNRPPAEALRGALHYQAGRYDRAADALRGADGWPPQEQRFALYYLALSLERLGRADEAKRAFDRLAALTRAERFTADAAQRADDLPAQVKAARANLDAGQPREAAALLEQALRRLGDDADAWTALAECYARLNRPDAAEDARRRAAGSPKRP